MKTYVPEILYSEITARPDWPEIEDQMKKLYGDSWELVPIRGPHLPEFPKKERRLTRMDENKLPFPYDPVYDVSKIRPIDANALVRGIEEAQGRLRADGEYMWELNKPYFKGLAWANRLTRDAPTLTVEDFLSKRGESLTLEKLRERDGKSVWIYRIEDKTGWWAIVRIGREKATTDYGGYFLLSDYGITWFAYDYPPAHIDREAWKPCEYCNGEKTLYQHTNSTKLFMNTFGKAATLITECIACPPHADCCMKDISANSAFRVKFCPECGRPLTEEAWAMLEKRLMG